MKQSKSQKLLTYLVSESDRWFPSSILADYLSVSTRQIRKYITAINQEAGMPLIISGKQGYKIDMEAYKLQQEQAEDLHDTPVTRVLYIIQKLVSEKDGYSVFDLADELYVSTSTIENDLKEVRQSIKKFTLSLQREKDYIRMIGEEKKKRNLMSYLISSDSYDTFVLQDEVRFLTFHYHFWDFRSTIREIFAQNDVFVNDYTLNNTALHLIITIDRIRSHCTLEEQVDLHKIVKTQQYRVAQQIKEYIEATYTDVMINDAELYNLTLVISNNTTMIDYSFITSANISDYIEQKYIDIAHKVLENVTSCYCLEPFDEEFTTKFTIHVKNLFNRAENRYFMSNPLTSKIKTSFPLIYDIAVFIAQEFKRDYQITLTEDEITFIAFHIGAHFENNVQGKTKVNCAFIYADYYSMHKHVLNKIMTRFEDHIHMKYVLSASNYHEETMECDFIISTVEMPFSIPSITIHPFLTERDLARLSDIIETISTKKKNRILKTFLINFFDEQLFYKNPAFPNKEVAIQIMAKDAANVGYTESSFYEDVLAREKMSGTAFHDVAVPHSLSKSAHTSFISIAISEDPLSWGNHQVHMIAMIGVNEDSRKLFAELFDALIEILSEPANIKELIKAVDFDDFMEILKRLMDTIS